MQVYNHWLFEVHNGKLKSRLEYKRAKCFEFMCVYKGRGVSENLSSCSLCQPVTSLEKVNGACVCIRESGKENLFITAITTLCLSFFTLFSHEASRYCIYNCLFVMGFSKD